MRECNAQVQKILIKMEKILLKDYANDVMDRIATFRETIGQIKTRTLGASLSATAANVKQISYNNLSDTRLLLSQPTISNPTNNQHRQVHVIDMPVTMAIIPSINGKVN